MTFGALNPFPRRLGSQRGNTIQALTDSILSQLGTAYDTGTGSKIWVKAHATALALWTAVETSRLARNQVNPLTTTQFLTRWERVFGIAPPVGSSDTDRRAAVVARWQLIGKRANLGGIHALVRAILPNTFVDLVLTPSALAVNHAPVNVIAGSGGQPSGGVSIFGDGQWGSSCWHLAIQTQQPSWMTDADYHAEAGLVNDGRLRRFLPAWMTFGAFKDGSFAGSFLLDDASNLDNQRLSDVGGPLSFGGFTQRIFPHDFSQGAADPSPTYANFYYFKINAPTAITLSVTSATLRLLSGPTSRGAPIASGSTIVYAPGSELPAGEYVVAVTSGMSPDTLGVSPATFTLTFSSP